MRAEARRRVAVTGATGFIGRRLLPQLAAAGWDIRILVRRDPADVFWANLDIEVVQGDLVDAAASRRLVEGADAVVHLAGLIKAPRRADFMRANRDGTRHLAEAVAAAERAHLLLVSSLAAREPGLSDYAASKRAAEQAAFEVLGARLSVLRPPAVYGPGDRETLAFFELARLPWVPLLGAPEARSAVIHVDDLCSALVGMLARLPTGRVETASDAHPAGYRWREIMEAAAGALGAKPRGYFQLPRPLLRSLAAVGDIGRIIGRGNMLNSDKLGELRHLDWTVGDGELLNLPGWAPGFDLKTGFADAVSSYRAAGWLPAA
ncbi:MAG: Nucleoside-diphosphate-sugar epimerase [Hydrocarboniphaga sp.]|nr:Nucleoside-diphosphate-sugar epimerase [Hydrocarboniphaga sp.]